jgi:hypothetical protein
LAKLEEVNMRENNDSFDRLEQKLAEARSALEAAEALVARLKQASKETQLSGDEGDGRDPTHFRSSGPHLSEKGIAAVHALYDAGYSIEDVAAKIGISVSAAANRRREWKNSRDI